MSKIAKNQIEEIKNLIQKGFDNWVAAGKIIVDLLDDGGYTLESLSQAAAIPPGALAKFEVLGREQVIPQILFDTAPASKRLFKLPISEQRRLHGGSVEMVTADGETLNVAVKNLTSVQCDQLFNGKTIRTLGEQRAWLESKKTENAQKELPKTHRPYRVHKGEVYFDQGCHLTASQISTLLVELTS